MESYNRIRFADWIDDLQPSAMQRSVGFSMDKEFISFALGLPAKELFPMEACKLAARRVLDSREMTLQYSPPMQELKEQVVNIMAMRGVDCHTDEVFLTSGGQQGINLLARLLLNTGDTIIAEEFIYPGFKQVIEPYRPKLLTVKTNLQDGTDVEAIAKLLAKGYKPAFIYTITDGHNPLGVSMSSEKRKRLAWLAGHYGVPIIEDDPYGLLSYQTQSLPPLKYYEKDWVFYVGSFSKILAPSLRVGWLVVPKSLNAKLSIIKEASDINVTTFSQRCVNEFLKTSSLKAHIDSLKLTYKARRDIMLSSLNSVFQDVRYTIPQHGFFTWLELSPDIDADLLLDKAVSQLKVGYIPGNSFHIKGETKGRNCLRLNFSHSRPELIVEGMRRLKNLFGQPIYEAEAV